MAKPKILVTGATGHTGGAIARHLLAAGYPVRALIRGHDPRSAALGRAGAELAVADLFDPAQMRAALEGVQRAYYLPHFHPYMIQAAAVFAVAAREARLEHIVQMSQYLASPDHPSLATRQTWLVDRLFAAIPGIGHVILAPGMFADNFLRVIDFPALLGIYPVLTGKGRAAPVSDEDIARTAVAALADPARYAGRRLRPTGPTLLSGRDMAATIAGVLGHRVLPVDLPMALFYKVAAQQGVHPFMISGYRHYLEDMRRGAFEWDGGVTDTIQELTGAPAESFAATARRYAAQPFARPGIVNRLRAGWNFLRVPLVRGHDPDRYDRLLEMPAPPTPRRAMQNPDWQAERTPAPRLTLAA